MLEYSDIHHVPIFTGSWNVNSKVLPDASSLRDWLLPKNSQPSDIYAIGFQETVDLNMVNVVVTSRASDEMATYWIGKVKETLFETGNKYVLLVERHLVGLLFLVMVKQQLFEKVNDVRVAIQATGVLGVLGNKGGISIRLKLYDSLICFVCAHFHASRESVETRNLDYQTILEASNLAPVTTPGLNVNKSQYVTYKVTEDPHDTEETNSKIIDHEHIFWIGDLNYRIVEDVSLAEIFERISKGEWDVLRLKDQLLIEKTRNNIFSGFEEGILNFPPTYKYQPGTDLYEARPDRKLRAPAWCDRILWKTTRNKEAVKLIKYTTAPLNVSDHKPVYALFNCEVRQVVGTRMKGLYQELLFSVDKWINASNPKLSIEGRFIDFGMMSCEVRFNGRYCPVLP